MSYPIGGFVLGEGLGTFDAPQMKGPILRRSIEERWVSLINSPAWRRAASSGTGRRLIRSRPYRALHLVRRFALTWIQQLRDPHRFIDVEAVCIFIGHTKSGASLLGSLLDAHPDAVVADEIDVVRYVARGFRRDQIFHLLEKGARREASKGRVTARRLTPYSLAVPGQSQGRSANVRVIGESKAGPTTRRLGREPDLLEALDRRMRGVPVRYVHVVRDPFDPISAMAIRSGRSVADGISDYADQCRTLSELRRRIGRDRLLTIEYESFVRDPVGGMRAIGDFVGVEADEAYLEACAAIVDPDVLPERRLVEWSDRDIDAVRALIAETSFLRSYDRHGERRVG